MTQIDDLLTKVDSMVSSLDTSTPFFVAIDGHSAAGKSTFARALLAARPEAALIQTDDFYRVMDADARLALDAAGGHALYYDWQRLLDQVLQPLKTGKDVRFQAYDWGANALGVRQDIAATPVVIIEGCYSARPEFSALIDFVVLVETDSGLREKRQAERVDDSADWVMRWDRAERHYIETTHLRDRADMVVSGQ